MAIIDFRGPDCFEQWADFIEKYPGKNGVSPGGAAAMLGITRQGVRDLAKAGHLDMYRLYEKKLQMRASSVIISGESIYKYKELKSQGKIKPGPK